MNGISEDIIDYAIFHKVRAAEVYIENKKYESIVYDTLKKIKKFEQGIGIRLFFDDYYMYLSFNELNKNQILSRLKQLFIDNSVEANAIQSLFTDSSHGNVSLSKVKFPAANALLEEKVREIQRQMGSKRIQFRITQEEKAIEILNSNNCIITKNHAYTRAEGSILHDNKYIAKGTLGFEGIDLNPILIDKVMDKAIDQLSLNNLEKETLVAGYYPAVVSNGSGGILLHEICGHPLELHSIVNGQSIFKNNLNQRIASDRVNIVDNPLIKGEWGSSQYDDEGNGTASNTLIENGIVKNFLCDRFNSYLSNFQANGSARRESYRFPPTSRMSNTYLLPGESNPNEMLEGIERGIFIKEFTEGSIDVATGDFRVGIKEAYLIENGRVNKLLTNKLVLGNALETLLNLDLIGNDFSFSKHFCKGVSGRIPVSVGQPTVRYKLLNIR